MERPWSNTYHLPGSFVRICRTSALCTWYIAFTACQCSITEIVPFKAVDKKGTEEYHKVVSISKTSKRAQTFGLKGECLFIIWYCLLIFPVATKKKRLAQEWYFNNWWQQPKRKRTSIIRLIIIPSVKTNSKAAVHRKEMLFRSGYARHKI